MGHTVVGFDGKSPPGLMPAIGSYTPMIPFKLTATGTTTTEAVTFSQLRTIKGFIAQAVTNGVVTAAAQIAISASGNVLTIADGTGFDLDASGMVVYGFVWGDALA